MTDPDIRWRQRFSNFIKALKWLEDAVVLSQQRQLTELEAHGLIQRFEFTHELAWNVIKDYFQYQGNTEITGSRDAVRAAFNAQLVLDGDGWMDMITSRNQSAHTYDSEKVTVIADKIVTIYYPLFTQLKAKLNAI